MSLFGRIFGGPAVMATDAVTAVGNVVDQLFTSDEEKAQAEFLMAKLRQQPNLLQTEINKIEAGHRSLFVAGWRPAIGWSCAGGVLWAFLGHPIAEWIVVLRGLEIVLPSVPTENIFEMTFALLGMAGLRTFEKLTGKTK